MFWINLSQESELDVLPPLNHTAKSLMINFDCKNGDNLNSNEVTHDSIEKEEIKDRSSSWVNLKLLPQATQKTVKLICNECKTQYFSKEEFIDHIFENHPNNVALKCPVKSCKALLQYPTSIPWHLEEVHWNCGCDFKMKTSFKVVESTRFKFVEPIIQRKYKEMHLFDEE